MDPDDEPIVEDAEDSVPTFRAIEPNDDDDEDVSFASPFLL